MFEFWNEDIFMTFLFLQCPNYKKSYSELPSPHHVHSRAIILVLDQYIHLTEYILVLHY